MITLSRRTLVRQLPLIAAAVMVAVGAVGFWQARDLRTTPSAENLAVVDATATAEVQAEVSQALVRVLSYDFSDPATTQQAADQVLSGKARKEYDTLFASLQERAPGQQLVLSAQVQVAAVKQLTATSASLLVFLDQTSQRATDEEASISAAQLAVAARKIDGSWRITGLDPL